MSEHQAANPIQYYVAPDPRTVQAPIPWTPQVLPQIAAKPNPDRWVAQPDGSFRWWAGDHWTAHFSADPTSPDPTLLQVVAEPSVAAVEVLPRVAGKPNPDRWVAQPDGSFRWWAGDHWTAHFSADPTSPDPTLIESVVEPLQAALPAEVSAPDHFAQIRQLAELRDAGILTEEEFATKKAEILARM